MNNLEMLIILLSKMQINFSTHHFMFFISSRSGIAGPAPYRLIVKKAAYDPRTIACFAVSVKSPVSSNRPTANPPVNASPAPVVSTSFRFSKF